MNNIAFFATHSIFLTEEEISRLVNGESVNSIGYCVPVWVDAKTGRTTEPGGEVFCNYILHNSSLKQREVNIIAKKGYEIFLPNSSDWVPPPKDDYEKMSIWPSEERLKFFNEMEKWWFLNPKPAGVENLKRGYLRFETKNKTAKTHVEQHVIEISLWKRLLESLAT